MAPELLQLDLRPLQPRSTSVEALGESFGFRLMECQRLRTRHFSRVSNIFTKNG